MRRLSVSIIGSTGTDPRYEPAHVFKDDLAHVVCLLLAEAPRTVGELAATAAAAEDRVNETLGRLADLAAVRQTGDRFALNFSLLTRGDLARLDELAVPLSEALAVKVLARAAELEAALACLARNGEPGDIARLGFATVGCMGLDWHGIIALKELGHLGTGNTYPDGGRYVLIAEERGVTKPEKDYCGSHTDGGRQYYFTSFGDHSGPRHCLPDLFFRAAGAISRAEWPLQLSGAVMDACRRGFSAAYDALGAVVAGASSAEGGGVELLRRTGYLEGNRALVPVLTAADVPAVMDVITLVREAVTEWADEQMGSLQAKLAPLSPVRQGVDRRDFLNHVWHFIFGGANRILAEEGFMLDPAPGPGGQGRYVAWVAEAEFYRAVWGQAPFCL